jgi:hypothetical protein
MQNLTDEAEASIPTETTVSNKCPNMNRTVTVHRKAAKRTLPFDLAVEELHLVPSPPLPQAERQNSVLTDGIAAQSREKGRHYHQ